MLWTFIEWFGVISGVIYLWFEYKQNVTMWIIGLINALTYVFVYAWAKIYADMAFYIYSVGMSIYGITKWRRDITGKKDACGIEYKHLSIKLTLRLLCISVLVFIAISTILKNYTDSPYPHFDAFTTSLSIIGSIMSAHRIIEHWLVWTIVDGSSIILYYLRDLYPTMFLFSLYTAAAIGGYFYWKHKGKLLII